MHSLEFILRIGLNNLSLPSAWFSNRCLTRVRQGLIVSCRKGGVSVELQRSSTQDTLTAKLLSEVLVEFIPKGIEEIKPAPLFHECQFINRDNYPLESVSFNVYPENFVYAFQNHESGSYIVCVFSNGLPVLNNCLIRRLNFLSIITTPSNRLLFP